MFYPRVKGFCLIYTAAVAVTHTRAYSLCGVIDSSLSKLVSYPGSSVYNASSTTYYTGNERDLTPDCIFRPSSALDIAQFIKLIGEHGSRNDAGNYDAQFAVRDGGHTLFNGAANIDQLITVDMRGLDSLAISDDEKMVSIGGGGIWSNIYPLLTPYNLTVMGGRLPGIGVGGFSLGGGISFLARRHGFLCDNIYGYEVVLASGDIIYATADSHSDLWLALKGGSSNFGIVSRFDFAAFPQELMWGGEVVFNYTDDVLSAQAKAFSDFLQPRNFDDAAMMGIILAFESPSTFSISNSLFYMESVEDPPVFDPFMSIASIKNNLGLRTVAETVSVFGEGLPSVVSRAIELVYSFQNGDPGLYIELFQSWETGLKLFDNIEGLQSQFLIQPQPVTNGTNSFGLDANQTDLVLAVVTIVYSNSADDETVRARLELLIEEHIRIVDSRGLLIPFKYLNYADKSQNPFDSYGPSIKQQLQSVAKKYDPHGLFQTAMPGGFKVFP